MASAKPALSRRIKPAGWLAILVVVGVGGYLAVYHFKLGPRIVKEAKALLARARGAAENAMAADAGESSATTVSATASRDAGDLVAAVDGGAPSDAGTSVPDGGSAVPDATPPPTVSRDNFPSMPAALPAPATALPKLALPPLISLALPSNAVAAGSEGAALEMVEKDTAAATIVSVAALAAHPEAITAGLRAIWLFGFRKHDGALTPSCDPKLLRAAKLGVVNGSLAHFHLLAVLAGEPLPPVVGKGDEDALAKAYADGSITGGEGPLPLRTTAIMADCTTLPEQAFAFVVVAKTEKPMSGAELSAVAALEKDRPSLDQVGAFFQPGANGIGTFDGLFRAASAWAQVHVVPAPLSGDMAISRTFLDPPPPPPATPLWAEAGSASVLRSCDPTAGPPYVRLSLLAGPLITGVHDGGTELRG